MHEETHFSISTYLFQNQVSLVWRFKKIAQLSTWKLHWESCIFATDRPQNFWHSWGEWNLTLFWEVNVLLSFLSALIMGIVVKRFIKGVFLTPFFIQICIMVEKSSKLHFRARDLNRWKPMKNSLKCSSLPSQWWREGSPAFSCRVGLKLLLMLPQVLQFRCPVHKKFWLPVFIRASPRE